jgi:hypothetical protein
MKYMLLIYGNEQAWNDLGEEGQARLNRTHAELQSELRSRGELIDTGELPPEYGRVVRTVGGVAAVTDGPYAETKELLAGFYLLDCDGIERATEVAGRLLEAEFAPIDVRQVGW